MKLQVCDETYFVLFPFDYDPLKKEKLKPLLANSNTAINTNYLILLFITSLIIST